MICVKTDIHFPRCNEINLCSNGNKQSILPDMNYGHEEKHFLTTKPKFTYFLDLLHRREMMLYKF